MNRDSVILSESEDAEGEDYQDFIAHKKKPKLVAKCHSKTEGLERETECIICYDSYNYHDTITLGCGHEFCADCVNDTFHASITLQPYDRWYHCPVCREKVRKVCINYSKLNAKNKEEVLSSELAKDLKVYCY